MDQLLPILQRAKREDLCISSLIVLITVFNKADTKLTSLAKLANVTSAGITSMMDRLERRELVKRTNAPKDRRSFHIELTPKGVEAMGRILTPTE